MGLQVDIQYMFTMLGAARLVQFVLGILVLICIGVSSIAIGGVAFVYFVAVASLISSLVFLLLNILHFPEAGPFARLPWDLVEFALLALWTLFYFICGIITAVGAGSYKGYVGNMHSANGAASFFCFAATLVYGICAFIHFRRWRTIPRMSASTSVTQQTTTTTTVAGGRY